MIRYEMSVETFDGGYDLRVEHLTKEIWSETHQEIMDWLIEQFNSEYKWDGMFTSSDVNQRISNNEDLFILYLGVTPIGYIWFKEENETTCSMYNLYISKIIKRPNFSSVWFINKVCFEMFKHYKKIETECEDWHITMQNTFNSSGFTKLSDSET